MLLRNISCPASMHDNYIISTTTSIIITTNTVWNQQGAATQKLEHFFLCTIGSCSTCIRNTLLQRIRQGKLTHMFLNTFFQFPSDWNASCKGSFSMSTRSVSSSAKLRKAFEGVKYLTAAAVKIACICTNLTPFQITSESSVSCLKHPCSHLTSLYFPGSRLYSPTLHTPGNLRLLHCLS